MHGALNGPKPSTSDPKREPLLKGSYDLVSKVVSKVLNSITLAAY